MRKTRVQKLRLCSFLHNFKTYNGISGSIMVTKPDVMLNIGCTQDHNPEEENLKSKNLDCFYISKTFLKK